MKIEYANGPEYWGSIAVGLWLKLLLGLGPWKPPWIDASVLLYGLDSADTLKVCCLLTRTLPACC